MKKTIFSLVFLAVFAVSVPVVTRASGIPVLDAANLSQNVMTALYQVMHYTQKLQEIKTQLNQYEDQLRNSLAPAAYIWTQARKAMNELTEIQNQIAYYKRLSNADSLKSYLKTFATVDAYRGAAWFNEMSEENKKKMLKSDEEGLNAQKNANDNVARVLEHQQESLSQQAERLQDLQNNAQSAEGRLEAIQYSNQFLANMSGQLLELRSTFDAYLAAVNAQMMTEAAEKARHKAVVERLAQPCK